VIFVLHLRGAADIANGLIVTWAYRQRLLIRRWRSGKVQLLGIDSCGGGSSGGSNSGGSNSGGSNGSGSCGSSGGGSGCGDCCAVRSRCIGAAVWLVVHTANDTHVVDDGALRTQKLREQGCDTVAAEQVIVLVGP